MATCVPCVPVNVKKVEPKMLFVIVTCFSKTKSLNSNTWQPRKISPKAIVTRSEDRMLRTFPRWIALTASAIISDDMSRMNVEKDVSSMLKIWVGTGFPGGGCSR